MALLFKFLIEPNTQTSEITNHALIHSLKKNRMKNKIIICTNEDCPLSYSCWRFNCPLSQYQQIYARFEPQIDEVLGEVECKMYLETPNNEKSDVVRLWG